jgi:esterase/lipase
MTWHGQINRTIWEIQHLIQKQPNNFRLKKELLRTIFLQRYEFDRSLHIPRDDRSFLFLQENRASAVLLIHGANGSPAEMRDLGNFLYGRGFTVYCPRLSRTDAKKRPVSWESWVTSAQGGLTTLLEYTQRTVVIGLSLGGAIALLLERLHPVQGLVLLAPAVHFRLGIKGRFLAVARRLTPTLFYKFAGWNGEVIDAVEHVRKTMVKIKVPILALQARDDHILSSRGLKFLRRWTGDERSEIVLLPQGSHALTRSATKDEVFQKVVDFVQKIQPVRQRQRGDRRQRERKTTAG